MATLAPQQQQRQEASREGTVSETIEINDFMLKMIEVLNKRFGTMNHQINDFSSKAASKSDLSELKIRHEKEKEDLLSRIALLEAELSAVKGTLAMAKPPEPKVNRNILKHLE